MKLAIAIFKVQRQVMQERDKSYPFWYESNNCN